MVSDRDFNIALHQINDSYAALVKRVTELEAQINKEKSTKKS